MAGLATPVPSIALPAVSGVLNSNPRDLNYFGFAIQSTGAVAPIVRLWQGTDTTGVLLDVIGCTASGFSGDFYGPNGLKARGGIYVEVVQGTFVGSLRVA